jgi:serine/threonine protein kinase
LSQTPQIAKRQTVSTFSHSISIPSSTIKIGVSEQLGVSFEKESFGVVLAQVFHQLSVLSRSSDYARLPPISNLHQYPCIGYGRSFITRRVPGHALKGLVDAIGNPDKYYAYKSLRHYHRGNDANEADDSERVSTDTGASRLKNVLLEVQVLTHVPLRAHENIVNLIGFGWETNRIDGLMSHVFQWPFVVLEYAPFGTMVDLFQYLLVENSTRQSLCLDVGEGLSALHACDIIHGDVKMENVLVFPHQERTYIAKLADFGFTRIDLEGKAPMTKLPARSPPWDAPEATSFMPWADLHLTDVYSFGFLIWRTLCYGHEPFTENGGLLSEEKTEEIATLKAEDKIALRAVQSIASLPGIGDVFTKAATALIHCLQLDRSQRDLDRCLKELG